MLSTYTVLCKYCHKTFLITAWGMEVLPYACYISAYLFTSDCSSLSPFFISSVLHGEMWPFSFPKDNYRLHRIYLRLFIFVATFHIFSSSWGNVAFFFSKKKLPFLSYLPQIVRLCHHFSYLQLGKHSLFLFQKNASVFVAFTLDHLNLSFLPRIVWI